MDKLEKVIIKEEKLENIQYFKYINKENAYHTAHVLKKIIKNKPDHIKYLYLVVSSIDPEIVELILQEFDDDLQAKLFADMMSLIQFSKKEIESFNDILRKFLTEQFGGKYVLAKILENLDIEQKTTLFDVYQQRYPENASDFRAIMILFEDLFGVSEKDFNRIFSEVPSDVLSMAFCRMPQDKIDKLYNILSKGVKTIVQQGIEFGLKKYSRSEIRKAQQYIVEYSKSLERDGFIDPILNEETITNLKARKEK